ncbi:inorganic pyrophosphatase [Halanaerobium saccharolyticum]|uniref:inorganic diphosphatase n=1 Tax=Halanaerobium saccharolyticum TaxID=43595 RepID=A0A4R6LZT3_9FIRM|nr:inorganic diphosphatase [Halanaerobium saccharolyticum]TDO94418.1 inorganic pyrophosphatase [Halanaerobium saccharolyticum]
MSDNLIDVLVEIPKGSNNKYEYDKEKDKFRLDRVMYSPVYYPADYVYLEEHLLKEYEHFFSVYKNLEKKINIIGWAGIEEALQVIEESKAAYQKNDK